MAEGELKLKVDAVDARKQVDEFRTAIKALDLQFKTEAATTDQVKAKYAELNTAIEQSNLSTKDRVNLLTTLFHANNRAEVGFKSMATSMREMYREERLQNRTLGEMNGVLQAFGGLLGLGPVGTAVNSTIQSFQSFEFSSKGLGIALGQSQSRLAQFGPILLGLATPLAIAGAGMATWISYMNDIEERGKKASDALQDLRYKLGQVSDEQQRAFLLAKYRAASAQVEAAKSGMSFGQWVATFMGSMGGVTGMVSGAIAAGKIRATEITEAQVVQAEALSKLQDFEKKLSTFELPEVSVEATRRHTESLKERNAEFNKWYLGIREYLNAISAYDLKHKKPIEELTPRAGVGKPIGPGFNVPVELSAAENAWLDFRDSVQSGVYSMSSAIGQGVGGAFRNVFGEAHSLLQIFISEFLSSMAQLIAQRFIFGLFNVLSGGFLGGGTPYEGGGLFGRPSVGGGIVQEIRGLRADLKSGAFKQDGYSMIMSTNRARSLIAVRQI